MKHEQAYRDARETDALQSEESEALTRALERAQVLLPKLDSERFAKVLGQLERGVIGLNEERVDEVAIAVGIGQGLSEAAALFEKRFMKRLPAALAHMKLSSALVDDIGQEVRQKLLVGEPPKIVGYAGRGSMAGLVKVTATRTAISMIRKQRPEEPDTGALKVGADPELDFLKDKYQGAFKAAFETAARALEPRERNMLRMHFRGQMTLDEIAQVYGVHRATAVRQLASTREKLNKRTKAELRSKLDVSKDELESILALVESRMDVTVERVLATMTD